MSFDEGAAAESWAHLPLDKDCVPVLPGQSCMSKVKHDLDLKAKAGTRGTDNPKYPWRTYEQYHDRHGKQHHEQPLRTELKWEQRLGQLGTAIRQIEKMSSPQGLVPAAVPKPFAEVDELKAQYDSMKKLIEDPDHQFKHTFGCPVSHYPAKQHYDTAKYPEPPPDIYANPSGPPPARPVFPPSLRVKNQEEIAQLSTAGSFAPGASMYGPGSMFEHGSGRGGWSSERQCVDPQHAQHSDGVCCRYVDQHRERRGGSYDAAIEYTPLPSEACLSRDAWVAQRSQCCSVLQCAHSAAVCDGVLQCAMECCSVLTVVCCSVRCAAGLCRSGLGYQSRHFKALSGEFIRVRVRVNPTVAASGIAKRSGIKRDPVRIACCRGLVCCVAGQSAFKLPMGEARQSKRHCDGRAATCI